VLSKPARGGLKGWRVLVKRADATFSLLVRALYDGRCVLCGSSYHVQCAHLFSRRYYNTRWDPENAIALCARHHMRFTHKPIEWDELLRRLLGEVRYEHLRIRAQMQFRGDLSLLLVALRAELKRIA
jgi:predicted restriction endonuclease